MHQRSTFGGTRKLDVSAHQFGALAHGNEADAPFGDTLRKTGTAILDFQVENVDTEFGRMKDIVRDWVFEPKDQPWGNRAMLFRDPDGNLVNVYMTGAVAVPASASARRRKAT